MEGKKRFTDLHYLDNQIFVYDNKLKSKRVMGIEECFELLNQQDARIKELEEENKFLEKRNEELTIDRRDFCLERNDIFEENQQLKQKAIVPKFQIGQTLYMIPTQFNGLIKIKEYKLLSIDLSDIGIRYHLVCKEKERGIEPFYCASEAMFGHSIFTTKEEVKQKLAEIKGEEK